MAGTGPIQFTITNDGAGANACEYKILITAYANTNEAFHVNYFFDLNTDLFNFVSIQTPPLPQTLVQTGNPPTKFQWTIPDLDQHNPQTLEITVEYKGLVGAEICPFLKLPEGKEYNYSYSNKVSGIPVHFHTTDEADCNVTVSGCGERVPFNFTSEVAASITVPCRYRVHLEVEVPAGSTVTDLNIFYTINTALFNFVGQTASAITTQPVLVAAPSTFKWGIGTHTGPVTVVLDIDLDYKTGLPTQVVDFITDLEYQINMGPKLFLSNDVRDLATACPTPCCECQCVEETETIEVGPCDGPKEVPVNVEVQPQGNILFVNLLFPSVCPNRDMAVLVMLFEVVGDVETLKAYRIIKRFSTQEAAECGEGDACSNITFLIPSDCLDCACDACPPRKFKVKTTAHYLATGNILPCQCAGPRG